MVKCESEADVGLLQSFDVLYAQVENMKEEQSSSTQLLYTRNSKLVCEGDLVVEYDLDWGMHLDFLCVPSLYRLKQQT